MSKKPSKDKQQSDYAVHDIVLGKLRGYPPWPAIVLDADHVPKGVAGERPKGRVFCVRFFPRGDHAWLTTKDLIPISREEIDAYIAQNPVGKRTGELLDGYKAALDPTKWEAELAAKEADADGAEEEEGEGKSRKRRRDSAPRSKKGNDAGGKKMKRAKKNGAADADDDVDEHPSKRKKADKDDDDAKWAHLKDDDGAVKIKSVRHQLQKSFLGKNGPLSGDMEESDNLFKGLETQDLSIDYLSFSKIGKVMRHIASLDEAALPDGADARYHFRSRAADLVARWHRILNKASATTTTTTTAAATNGKEDEDA